MERLSLDAYNINWHLVHKKLEYIALKASDAAINLM